MEKFKIIVITILVLVHTCCTHSSAQSRKKGRSGPALVRADKVRMLPRQTSQTFVGSFEPVRRSMIGSAVEERIEEVFVEVGDYVDNTDGLVQLLKLRHDTVDIAVKAAEVELQLSKHALTELQKTIPNEVVSAKADIARLNAELQYAKQVFDRTRTLGTSMSQKEIEEANSRFNSARQSLAIADAKLSLLESTREVRLGIAKQNVQRQEVELQRTRDQQTKHTVVAPFSGYVSKRMAERGNWVTRGTPLIELVQIDPIQLRIQVPQEFGGALQNSFEQSSDDSPLNVNIEVDSLDQPINGTVFRIAPDADQATRSISVLIRVNNPTTHLPTDASSRQGHLLKPGLLATARMVFGEGVSVTMIPKDALVLNRGKASVFVIDELSGKKTVRQVSIDTGESNQGWIEVIGDVQADDTIVVQGNERLREGQEVKVLQ